MVVLSQLACKHELGSSLLERLFTHYKTKHRRSIQKHTAALLTNYRCHPSILTLSSSLFYEHTLLSRSESKAHPLAPYPLVFACSSLQKQSLKCLPDEDTHEADLLVNKMLQFVKEWPKNENNDKPIGLLASTRKQVCI